MYPLNHSVYFYLLKILTQPFSKFYFKDVVEFCFEILGRSRTPWLGWWNLQNKRWQFFDQTSSYLFSYFVWTISTPTKFKLSMYWCLAHRKYDLWISSFFTVKIGIDWILSGNGTTYNTIGAKWSMKSHSIFLFYTPYDLTKYFQNLLSSLQTNKLFTRANNAFWILFTIFL